LHRNYKQLGNYFPSKILPLPTTKRLAVSKMLQLPQPNHHQLSKMLNSKHTPMKSKHKYLTFNTLFQFKKWLKATTAYQITFEDKGQDLLQIWIDKDGEILHANLQVSIWIGRMVEVKKLAVGKPINIWVKDHWEPYNGLIVKTKTAES